MLLKSQLRNIDLKRILKASDTTFRDCESIVSMSA